jgi:hypothetical protein
MWSIILPIINVVRTCLSRVVTCAINPIANPNPVYIHTLSRDDMLMYLGSRSRACDIS